MEIIINVENKMSKQNPSLRNWEDPLKEVKCRLDLRLAKYNKWKVILSLHSFFLFFKSFLLEWYIFYALTMNPNDKDFEDMGKLLKNIQWNLLSFLRNRRKRAKNFKPTPVAPLAVRGLNSERGAHLQKSRQNAVCQLYICFVFIRA